MPHPLAAQAIKDIQGPGASWPWLSNPGEPRNAQSSVHVSKKKKKIATWETKSEHSVPAHATYSVIQVGRQEIFAADDVLEGDACNEEVELTHSKPSDMEGNNPRLTSSLFDCEMRDMCKSALIQLNILWPDIQKEITKSHSDG